MCGDGRHGKLGLEENENNVHEMTHAVKYDELTVTDVRKIFSPYLYIFLQFSSIDDN